MNEFEKRLINGEVWMRFKDVKKILKSLDERMFSDDTERLDYENRTRTNINRTTGSRKENS